MKTPKAFITYSHKDTDKRARFETALAVMVQKNEIEIWCDAKIPPGDEWEKEIMEKLEESDIVLYLVSAASLASKNCNKELTDTTSRKGNIKPISIILEKCDFLRHPLAKFEALPTEKKEIKPISKWNPQSDGWQNVVDGIWETIENIPPDTSTPEEPDDSTPPPTETPPPQSPPTSSTPQGAAPSASLTPTQATAEFLFGRANFFLMLGNYDAAIRDYTKALKINPTVDTYNNRGVAYDNKDEHEKAITDFDNAIELNPNDFLTYNNRGLVYFNKGKFDKAIADFNRAIELKPNNFLAYNNRGNFYQNEGKFDKAIVDFSKAIELNPNIPQALFNRGAAYSMKKKYHLAIADFNKAIKLDPKSIEAYVNRGHVYCNKGELELALIDLNKAIELNPDNAVPYNNRARVYFTKGDIDKAVTSINKAIELDPNYAQAYFNRGVAKQALRDHKGAKQDFQTALKLAEQQGKKSLGVQFQKTITAVPNDSNS